AAGYPLRALHFLLGPEFRVAASTLFDDETTGTNIYGSAFLKTNNGIGAHIDFGFDHFYQCNYELWGSKGKITAHRAYTPAADFTPVIQLEQQGKSENIIEPACNHFVASMKEFHNIIIGKSSKRSHYDSILLQSESLELIKSLSVK
ncbi:MAG TPA: hypothetical protein VGB43_04330, partial [Flavobacterium sp.]